ncbi:MULTISPECIES: hypothetical protein [Serratia]|uniref:hypothetical protein n=1 Tax=Serratia TaxID=613 RepID=UPI0002AF410B|nr:MULTISPECIES: hypothetical protein [Serratia]AGE16128.1 hypothetical protein SMWW4_v1c03210 [Serratia marcescens WW4]AXX20735.1 hypothetical protein C7M66_16770 [Serratia marcescens]AXX26436.1 hypothetical protein C7M65_21235 [Serratia marcescens]ERH70789.1 hypothetical protein N040_22470 [Serratia marcescens EGD-HP20]MBH2602337.1 hypothetical protein [Serratia marcescens]
MKRYGYAIAALLAMGCCAIAGYFLFFRPQIPECRAVEHVTDNIAGRSVERIVLINVVPDGPRRINILLNGRVYDGKEHYVVSRTLVLDYRWQGNNYTLWVKENIKKPHDSIRLEDFNRRLPVEGMQLHWRIEQIDSRHFLFADNHAPLFVCATP